MTDYARARTNMVESQLRTNKVGDPALLKAFHAIAREDFVPAPLKSAAYLDEDLPLGNRRFLMEPMILARLVQEAEIRPADKVLEVGCGTGYGAALLSRLGGEIVALEADPVLAAAARAALAGFPKVTVVEQALPGGCPAEAPYDVILLGGAVPSIPPALLDQLAPGGRLVAVIRPAGEAPGEAVIMERVGGGFSRRSFCDAGSKPLPGFAPAPEFSF
jgi:protein-L-isoaspartate(D-aspartate) O-methyltransferase